ncbi:MAG: GlcNAc-transferase family protein [Pseudomonadota bacterium]
MQIDAHTQFAENWDSRFIEMLKATGASKPILTTYPTPFSYRHGQVQYAQNHGIQKLILNRIRKDLTTIYRAVPVEDTSKPQPCQFIAAGQIFTLGQFCEEVQYDPNLYFSGEEISLSARAFTHGYECFCPNEDLLWHFYQHDMPVHSVDHPQNQHLASIDRLDTLFLGDHEELGRYGFGQHATIQEFEKFSGIDFNASKNRQPNPVHYQETIRLNLHGIEDRDDYDLWIFTLRDNDDKEIYRQDLKGQDIPAFNKPEIILNVELTDAPVSYGLWPRSKERGFHPSRFHDIPLPRA